MVKTSFDVGGCSVKQDLCPPILTEQGSRSSLGVHLKCPSGSGAILQGGRLPENSGICDDVLRLVVGLYLGLY